MNTVSVVLRVLVGAAVGGRVVGHAEVVDTGEVVAIPGVDDLVALLRRVADDAGAEAG